MMSDSTILNIKKLRMTFLILPTLTYC